ncbi:MAG: hypothetical protein M5U34_24300 [Chloroflexi bacterium]|nr:hypothetical protein [Chloroflexota bacterium]
MKHTLCLIEAATLYQTPGHSRLPDYPTTRLPNYPTTRLPDYPTT